MTRMSWTGLSRSCCGDSDEHGRRGALAVRSRQLSSSLSIGLSARRDSLSDSLALSIYIYMYVCMYVCIYIYIYIYPLPTGSSGILHSDYGWIGDSDGRNSG